MLASPLHNTFVLWIAPARLLMHTAVVGMQHTHSRAHRGRHPGDLSGGHGRHDPRLHSCSMHGAAKGRGVKAGRPEGSHRRAAPQQPDGRARHVRGDHDVALGLQLRAGGARRCGGDVRREARADRRGRPRVRHGCRHLRMELRVSLHARAQAPGTTCAGAAWPRARPGHRYLRTRHWTMSCVLPYPTLPYHVQATHCLPPGNALDRSHCCCHSS